ncbi:hypothetical protein AURDEDRAFT_99891 [Auricularia subglabra TFB-10046 SS5]|nr:hypothetical protein AURDEDRAFT_99891 [Auricularia subglabra TFB-10046 SS5]
MLFTPASLVLLAASALAIPTREERHRARLARRGVARQSQPVQLLAGASAAKLAAGANETVAAQQVYSANWAGAALNGYASGTFRTVSATFTVPTPKTPPGGSSAEEYYASAWVGIDGYSCGSAILQTGVDFIVQGKSVSYDVWYEWWPDYAYLYDEPITVKAGDRVELSVVATSTKTGSSTVRNLSSGWTSTQQIKSGAALCESDAEWIVEDFASDGGQVPFANFGTVTLSNAVAGRFSSGNIGPSNATLIDIKQNDKVLTKTTVSSSSVTVKYIG